MKEMLMPLVFIAGAIVVTGLALLMPMILIAAYRDLIKREN